MPLHLKEKLRKALRKDGTSTSGPNDGEGRFVQAGSMRESGQPSLKANNKTAPELPKIDAGDKNTLSAGVEQLTLDDTLRQNQNRVASRDGAEAIYADSRNPEARVVSRDGSHGGYARSTTVGSDDDNDPYSERVADRNISSPRNWTHNEDVNVETTQLKPVTHETRVVDTHEIVEQRITRDIHNYDVIHRELPVIDVEVLPPRHFVPSATGDGLVEIPASQVPGGGSDDAAIQRSIKQAILKEKLQPRSAGAS